MDCRPCWGCLTTCYTAKNTKNMLKKFRKLIKIIKESKKEVNEGKGYKPKDLQFEVEIPRFIDDLLKLKDEYQIELKHVSWLLFGLVLVVFYFKVWIPYFE